MLNEKYIAESANEGKRLKVKTDIDQTREHLTISGLHHIPTHARIVDAGAGVGVVSKIMFDMLKEKNPPEKIFLVDISKDRLGEAETFLATTNEIHRFEFIESDLEKIDLPSNSVDFIFCRFVFEYMRKQQAAFNELHRILKAGGKLVVGDLDYAHLTFFPLDVSLKERIDKTLHFLLSAGFDIYAGQKLYSYFHNAKMKDIQVFMGPHNLMYGELKECMRENWSMKFDLFIKLSKERQFDFGFDMETFKIDFMEYLSRPERFSYTPFILVQGIK